MSKEFIESKLNSSFIHDAATQEEQLSYFLENDIENSSLTEAYINQWALRKYQSNDYFLNYVKSIFKEDVFLKFFKYLRKPIPSAKLIKNRIEPQLKRVFISENADFKYDVTGAETSQIKEDLNNSKFESELFYHLLFRHNSLIVSDIRDKKAFRYFLEISKVISIEEIDNVIKRIAFPVIVNVNGENKKGIIYIDSQNYMFYDTELNFIDSEPNELGYVPIHYITDTKYKNQLVIKESLFTFLREELEEYVFLKTIQKMTEPNGAIPVITTIKTDKEDNRDIDSNTTPLIEDAMSSQRGKEYSTNPPPGFGIMQPGTVHELTVESLQDDNGSLNTALLDNFINFSFIPVEALNYLNDRIKEIENSIITTTVGDVLGGVEDAQNELQIQKSLTTLQNNVIHISELLNRARKLSDQDMLRLNYGVNAVNEVFIFYGTDFFFDSETKLYEDLEKAPNPIERKNILIRINQNKYKSNQDQLIRQKILYSLLPYATDKDFEIARNTNLIDGVTIQYQLRFTYWIQVFEAQYGDIVAFYNELDIEPIQKFILINNLITNLIIVPELKTEENENNSSKN